MGTLSNLKKIFTLNCQEAASLLSARQDTPLSLSERAALNLHLLICRACRRYSKQLQFIRNVFKPLRDKEEDTCPELRISSEKRNQMRKIVQEKTDSKE